MTQLIQQKGRDTQMRLVHKVMSLTVKYCCL